MVVSIPTQPDRAQPTIYNLKMDYARFGLSATQAAEVLNNCFPFRGGYGAPEFLFLHTQDGKTTGSLLHWVNVQASSTVMIQKDGSILRVIPEEHGPWTNGDEQNPTPEAKEIIALGGNPNNWTLSAEAEGDPDTPYTDAQFDALVWWAEDAIIRYPNILNHLWSILRHRFINSVTRWNCPDRDNDPAVVGPHFDRLVGAINTWLETAVVPAKDTETPQDALPPLYPEGMSFELARALYGELTVPWSSKTFAFDPARAECQMWLARGKARIPEGQVWSDAPEAWPELVNIIRRGASKNVHVYVWSNGDVYEKIIRPA